jgi:chromate reductase
MRLLAISGSLRRGSYNRALLDAARAELPLGVDFVLWNSLVEIPPYDEDRDGSPPAAVAALKSEIARSDAVLFATPEYNASVPGVLKNALDWVSRPHATNVLRRKPVAVIGASQGLFGATWAQADLRKVLASMGADVVDAKLAVGRAHEAFTDDGRVADPQLADALRAVVDQLVRPAAARAA